MSVGLALALLPLVVVTSVLSGVFGMAGGLVLMGAYALLLPVPAAMVLHGVTQLAANGARAFFLREYVQWRLVGTFLAGSAAGTGALWVLGVVADRAVVFLALGGGVLAARIVPAGRTLSIDRPPIAFAGGLVVGVFNVLAGAAGPLLDVLFVPSALGRHAVIATKAVLQSAGHVLKIAYFAGLVTAGDVPAWLYVAVVAAALVGTRVGRHLLDRLDDKDFRLWSARIVVTLGVVFVIRGVTLLV